MKKANFREDGIFHDIREWIFTNVIDDSLMNIPDYVACKYSGKEIAEGVLTPPRAAAMLDEAADQSERHAKRATGIERRNQGVAMHATRSPGVPQR